MRFLACGFFICVLLCWICAYVFVNIFYHAPLFTLLTNYLHCLSALPDAQFIPAYLIYKLNASRKICLSAFRNGKLLQALALVNLLFSHTEYLAKNGKHTSSLASCVYYISFLTYITKNECNRPFYSCWPSDLALNGSEAGVDLVLIQTSLLLLCKSSCSYAN